MTVDEIAALVAAIERAAQGWAAEYGYSLDAEDAAAWCLDDSDLHPGQWDAYRAAKAFLGKGDPP